MPAELPYGFLTPVFGCHDGNGGADDGARTVAFSPAVYEGQAVVEDRKALRCTSDEEVKAAWAQGYLAVLVDEKASIRAAMKPDVLVDAILAKYNCGTQKTDAPTVIGVGPGFTAGVDCHCVIETRRGHDLGRCIWQGSAQPNTGIPGNIGGYTAERILRAPCDGVFHGLVSIGAKVTAGEVVGEVDQTPMCSQISGVVRGLLQDGVGRASGNEIGDVDPRMFRPIAIPCRIRLVPLARGAGSDFAAFRDSCSRKDGVQP